MRHPLHLRLRPFLRRDLRARLTTSAVTAIVLSALAWLGVSALTRIDSQEAHHLRTEFGLEAGNPYCGGHDQPVCSYEDREQVKVDRKAGYERRLRLAVLEELGRRVALSQDRLDDARAVAEASEVSPRGFLQGDTVNLRVALLQSVVDLRPASVPSVESRRERLLWPLEAIEDCEDQDFDGIGWVDCKAVADKWRGHGVRGLDMRSSVLKQIELEQVMLTELSDRLASMAGRESQPLDDGFVGRVDLVADVTPTADTSADEIESRLAVAAWLAVRPPSAALEGWDLFDSVDDVDIMTSSVHHSAAASGLPEVHFELAGFARNHLEDLIEAVLDPEAAVWHGGWTQEYRGGMPAIVKPTERYRSPIGAAQRWRLVGTFMFVFASLLLVVVGPVVTATSTAREREAGTLPVLRMTGMSAIDLALAMAIGPNVFALVGGLGMLVVSTAILAVTAGPAALLVPLVTLAIMTAATHLTAIGLGDALGHRVNAMIVGGLMAMALVGPGLIGTTMVVGDMAATGFLLGPVPATLSQGLALSGVSFAEWGAHGGRSELGQEIFGYAVVVQALLGGLCLLSWRRRVEQAWTPLFRPFEGAALALASVGCSALAVLDLSDRVNVQTYDHVNLITFVATGFLMPVLGWLLVSSLVRPARAASVASVEEVRRGFLRFQAFVGLTAVALATTYSIILDRTGLGSEESEIMWATIAQGLLVAETAVATLLLASRRRENRHRIFVIGAAVVLLQLGLAAGVYNLEVEHVALTQTAGNPFLLGMDASPYWLAFMVFLWAAGLGLMLAALLRERDRAKQEAADAELEELDDEDDKPQKWLH